MSYFTRFPCVGNIIWSADLNRLGWRSFLGVEPGTDLVPAAAVPARLANFAGLPPTFLGVGSIDLFADEDIQYARRLIVAKVPTELHVIDGAFHGFDRAAAGTRIAADFVSLRDAALRRAFDLS